MRQTSQGVGKAARTSTRCPPGVPAWSSSGSSGADSPQLGCSGGSASSLAKHKDSAAVRNRVLSPQEWEKTSVRRSSKDEVTSKPEVLVERAFEVLDALESATPSLEAADCQVKSCYQDQSRGLAGPPCTGTAWIGSTTSHSGFIMVMSRR